MTEHYQVGHGAHEVAGLRVRADLKLQSKKSFAQNLPKMCPNEKGQPFRVGL